MRSEEDLSRAVDFLAERPELDLEKLGYVGWSRGGCIGARLVVLEPRFKACILMSGGLHPSSTPEIDTGKFAPLVKIPCLLLGGRYDTVVNYGSRQVPLFNSLGCSDKEFVEFDSGHVMQIEKAVAAIDRWLRARFPHEDRIRRTLSEQLQWNESLATGYMGERLYELAEAKFEQVIEILRRTSGLNTREMLKAEYNRALVIERQDRFAEAKKSLEDILQRQTTHLGADDQDTLMTAGLLQALEPSAGDIE